MENQAIELTEEMFISAGWKKAQQPDTVLFERQISTEDEDGDDLEAMILCFGNAGFNVPQFWLSLPLGEQLIINASSPEEMNKWADLIYMYMPNW